MKLLRILTTAVLLGITSITNAEDSRVPKWDARGLGLLPAQGVACLDISEDGSRIVVGTIALPGETNVHVLDADGKVLRSYRVGQRWISQVAATSGEQAFALCTMSNGKSGDEPLVFFCGEEAVPLADGAGGMSLFHYGDHSNHIGKQLLAYPGGAVTMNENQLLWLTHESATPRVKSAFRNLKATALAVHRSGVAVVGGYVDGDPRTDEPGNLFVIEPGAATAKWSRPVVSDVGASNPPEPGEYGRPVIADGSNHPLPQRDEPMFAPLSIAVTQEKEFNEAATRIAAADYRGWQRWIRSSATGKDENYGARFMPAKPTVTVYDGTGTVLKRFSPEKFSHAGWVDLAFLPGGQKLLAFPHHWTCRGLAGQSVLPADDHASTMWLLDVASGEVRAREFPDAIANVAVGENGTVAVSCWNGRVYRLDEKTLVEGDLPAGFEVGKPALVHVSQDGNRIIAATTAGEIFFLSANGELLQRVDLNQVIPRTEKTWVKNANASPLAKGLWQMPGGRVESDLGGQRLIEAPDGLILIEGHSGLSFESEWAAIEAAGLDPRHIKYILATHEHGDHAPGAYLWRVATGAQFVCSREMAYTLQHHLPLGTGYGLHPPVPTDIKIDEDTVLDLAGLKVAALRLPGHTYGSMGWLFEREGKRFVAIGDLIMPEGRLGYAGSVNFSPQQVLESLRKLDGMRVDTILPGHGPVVGPDIYIAAGIAVGSRVGWGKMNPEKPEPRFAITQPNVIVTAFLAGATSADFGDVDGDGLPDVAVVAPREEGSVVKVFLNHGDREGRFDPMQADFEFAVPSVESPTKLRLRSLNDDKRSDIFIGGRSAAILLSGERVGEYAIQHSDIAELHQIRAMDVEGMGIRDWLVCRRFGGVTRYAPPNNNANIEGRLIQRELKQTINAPYVDVREIDLNGDGRSDWVSNMGGVWLRAADGSIPEIPTQQLPLSVPNDWHYCSVGDINGDGKPDVMLESYGMQQRRLVTCFHNTGDVKTPFAEQPNVTLEIESEHPHVRDSAPVGDWNGDGIDDLVIGLGQDNQVRIFLGSETGLSADRVETISLEYWIHYEHALSLADFNADGRLDLACFGYTQTGVGASGPPTAYIWLQPQR